MARMKKWKVDTLAKPQKPNDIDGYISQFPYDLIERIVNLRVKQDSTKAEAKRKKKSQTSRKPRVSQ
jgi:hypothetical protein